MAEQAQAGRGRSGLTVAIIAALVAGAVALVPWVYSLFTKREASLSYSVNSGPSVYSQGSFKKIMVLRVNNDGKGAVKNVFAQILLDVGIIEQTESQLPAGLRVVENQTENKYNIAVENLNEGEKFNISFLLELPNRHVEPSFAVRADDVIVGLSEDRLEDDKSKFTAIFGAGTSVIAVLIASMFMMKTLKMSTRKLKFQWDDYDNHDIMTYIFRRVSLPEMVDLVYRQGPKLTYRGIADALYFEGLKKNKNERQPYVTALKCILLVQNIADESVNIIIWVLQKLDSSISDDEISVIRSQATDIPDGVVLRQRIDESFAMEM